MNNIEQLFKEWQQLQPLKPEDQKRLDDKFRLEFIYNSNHIEGNTLTYEQTELLLIFGETTGDAKMRDYEEMKAHNVGLRWIEEMVKDVTHQLTERDIRNLNKIILVEDYWKLNPKNGTRFQIRIGVYKTRPNSVITATGEEFQYASPEETPAMMHEFVSWLNKEIAEGTMSPIELVSLLHYRYIRIHPFEDGNGRIARLLVTYVLERFGYPMIIIKSQDKESYLRALNQSDINVGLTPSDGANAKLEDIEPFVEYMEKQLEWSLEISIKAAKGESIEEDDDFVKRIALLEREAKQKENEKKKYFEKKSDLIFDFIEKFYLPFTEEIISKLKPSEQIFETVECKNQITQGGDSTTVFFFKTIDDLKNSSTIDYSENPKILSFVFFSKNPKIKISDKNFFIGLSVQIQFEEKYYIVENLAHKHVEYGKYPSLNEKEEIIMGLKNEFIEKVKGSVNETK